MAFTMVGGPRDLCTSPISSGLVAKGERMVQLGVKIGVKIKRV
jgi:hypothetical protein